jgi:dTDP-4-amino-4,6-dideoxygalactose transaminase
MTEVRTSFLPFVIPDTDETEIDAVAETIRSGWLTTGARTREFEDRFAAAVGAKHAMAVNSCTAAMHLALEAVGLRPGDEVLTTPRTFAATAEVVRYFGARRVFVDVDDRCLNLRADLLEGAITDRARAVMPVHVAGLLADLDSSQWISGTVSRGSNTLPAPSRQNMRTARSEVQANDRVVWAGARASRDTGEPPGLVWAQSAE